MNRKEYDLHKDPGSASGGSLCGISVFRYQLRGMIRRGLVLLPVILAMGTALGGCSEAVVYEDVAVKTGTQSALQTEGTKGVLPGETAQSVPSEERSLQSGLSGEDAQDPSEMRAESFGTEEPDRTDEILVYVCGAVVNSGVYAMPEGSRIYQAIEAAGGMTPEADDRRINQAMMLSDGDQITVLTKEEAAGMPVSALTEAGAGGSSGTASPEKININTADAETLQKLNGIGASRASDIIAYREANGAFRTIEDIMKVSGIKNSLFDRIKDSITTG